MHSLRYLYLTLLFISLSLDLVAQADQSLYSLSEEYGTLSESQLLQQERIDSFLAVGENMFFAEGDVIFKNDRGISATAEIISKGDLLILLNKLDDRYYEVEWDNKVGFIFQYHLRSFNMNTSVDEIEDDMEVNVEILPQIKEEPSEESYEQAPITAPQAEECNIQFFASQFSNKQFTILNDLGSVRAIIIPDLGITRYHLIPHLNSDLTCENILQQIQGRGFRDAFIVEEE